MAFPKQVTNPTPLLHVKMSSPFLSWILKVDLMMGGQTDEMIII